MARDFTHSDIFSNSQQTKLATKIAERVSKQTFNRPTTSNEKPMINVETECLEEPILKKDFYKKFEIKE